ncbi:MAG: M48 family metalloprotease [Bacteroidota bacterium]
MRWLRRPVWAIVIAFSSLGCSGSLGLNIFPDSKDIELGKQVDAEIRKDPKDYPLLTNRPDIKAYVAGVGKKILDSPEIKKRGIYAYQFEIIKDDSTVNAFCTPGGYVYVYTGLLKFLDNEASLAGVIGHEIAHAERRHATRRMTTQLGYQALLAIVLGQSPKELEQVAGNLFTGLALLKNSRSDEEEADTYSFKYLQSTEYYPGAIKYFFEKVQAGKNGARGGTLERFLSTHPLPQDRFDHVEHMLTEAGNPLATEQNLFSKRYLEFRDTLP